MQEIDINLRCNRFVILALFGILLASLIIITKIPLPLLIRFSLALIVLGYFFWILKHPPSITRFKLNEQSCQLYTQKNVFQAQLCGDSTLTHWVSVLRFKIPEKRFKLSCIIFRNSLKKEEYRRLLVMARNVKLHGIQTQNTLTSLVLSD